MEKHNYQKEVSIRLFLGVNPKLTPRKALKQKIEEICIWLDLEKRLQRITEQLKNS